MLGFEKRNFKIFALIKVPLADKKTESDNIT